LRSLSRWSRSRSPVSAAAMKSICTALPR